MKNIFKLISNLFLFICVLSSQLVASQNLTLSFSETNISEDGSIILTASSNEVNDSEDIFLPISLSGTATDGLDYNISFDSQGEESLIREFSDGINDFDYMDDGRLVTLRDYRNLDIYELDGTITSLYLNEGGQDYDGTDIVTNGSDIYIRNWYHIVKLDTETMELSYVIQNSTSGNLYIEDKIDFYDGKIYYVITDNNNSTRKVYSLEEGGSEVLIAQTNDGAIRNITISDSGDIYLWEQNNAIQILNSSGELELFSQYDNGYYQDVKFVNNNLYALVYDYSINGSKVIRFKDFAMDSAAAYNYDDVSYQLGSQVTSINHFTFSPQGELVLYNQLSGSSYQLSSYRTTPGITITAGETSGTLTINGEDDSLFELDETIIVTPGTVTNATLSDDSAITMTLTDNDTAPVVTFAFSSESIDENSSNTVTLTAASSEVSGSDITIPFTLSGTAQQTTEYTVSGSEILISTGSTSASVTISTEGLDDDAVEVLETIIFTFGNLVNATTDTTEVILNLLSEDNPSITSITPGATSIIEGESIQITATVDEVSSRDVVIPFSLSGTAIEGSDYNISFDSQGEESLVFNSSNYINTIRFDSTGKLLYIQNNQLTIFDVSTDSSTSYTLSNNYEYFDLLSDNIIYAKKSGQGTGIGKIDISDLSNIIESQQVNIENNHWIEGNYFNISGNTIVYNVYNSSGSGNSRQTYKQVGDNTPELIYEGSDCCFYPLQLNGKIYQLSSSYLYELVNGELTNYQNFDGFNIDYSKFIIRNNEVYLKGNYGNNQNQAAIGKLTILTSQISFTPLPATITNFNIENLDIDPTSGNLYTTSYSSSNNNYTVNMYQLLPEITITAGEITGILTITGEDDSLFELDETIIVTPGSPSNATLPDASAIAITLTDNDTAPVVTFAFSSDSIDENSSNTVTLTATLSAVSGSDVTIPFTLSGTAEQTTEYTVSGSEILISTGSTTSSVTISTEGLDDDEVEVLETIIFTFGTLVNATTEATDATLNLLSEDVTNANIVATNANMNEGESTSIALNLDTPTSKSVIVPLVFSGTADFNIDYTVDFDSEGEETFLMNLQENSSDFSTLEDGRYLLFNNSRLTIADPTNSSLEYYYLSDYFQYFNVSDNIVYLKSNDKIHKIGIDLLVPSSDPMTPNNITTTPILTDAQLDNNEYYAGDNISSEGDTFVYQIAGNNQGLYKVYKKDGDTAPELLYQGQQYAEKLLLFNSRVYAFNSNTVTELYDQQYTNSIVYNNAYFYDFKTYNNQLYSLVDNNGEREIVKLSIESDIINSTSNGTMSLVSYQLSDSHQYIYNFSFDTLGNLLLLNKATNSENSQYYRLDMYQLFPQIFIPAGGNTGTFTFNSVNDISFENDETIVITPGALENTTISSDDLTLTIIDDDNPPVITFELSAESIIENSETSVTLTATSDIPSGKEITIPFSLSGSAMLDEYEIIDGVTQIVIPGNSTSKSITISTYGYNDEDVELSETIIFNFDIENIINATSETASATLNLLDDELTTIASLESDILEVNEGNLVTLTATLTTESSADVYLPVVFGGTASYSLDYEADFESRGEETLIRELSNSYTDMSILSDGKIVLYRNNPSELVIYDSVENTFDTASLNTYINSISIDGNTIYISSNEAIYSVDITDISSGNVELTTVFTTISNTYINYFSVTQGDIFYRIYDQNIGEEQIYLRGNGESTSEILYSGGNSGYIPIAFNNKFYLIYENTVFELNNGELINSQTYSISGINGDVRVYREGFSNKTPKVINDKLYVRRTDDGSNSLMLLDPSSGLLKLENYNLGDDINYIQSNSIGYNGDLIFLNNYASDGMSWGLFSYLQSAQIKINAGQLTGSFVINTIDDASFEPTETITFSAGIPVGAFIDDAISSFEVEILDNDLEPTVTFALSNEAIEENSSNTVQLTATLDNISGYDTTISFADMSGTASADEYELQDTFPLLIPAGIQSASITISTEGKDDEEVEILETIVFTISGIENGTTQATEIVLLLASEDNPNLTSVVASPAQFAEHESSSITATIDAASSRDILIPLSISGTATDGLDYTISFDSQGEESLIKEFTDGVNDFDYMDDGRLVTIKDYRNLDIHELDGTITSIYLNSNGQDYEGTDIVTNGTDIYIRNWFHIAKLDTETMELSYVIQNSNSGNIQFGDKIDFYDGKIYYVLTDYNNNTHKVYSLEEGGSENLIGEANNGEAIRNVTVSDSGDVYLWEQNNSIQILNSSGELEHFSYYDYGGYYQDVKFVNNNLFALVYDYNLSKNKIIRFNGIPYQGASGPKNYEDLPYQLGSQVMSINHFSFSIQGELVLFNHLGSSYQLNSYKTIPEITILAGETSGSLIVNGLEDDLNAPGEEEDETIVLGLLTPTNAEIPTDVTIEDITLTILNNEITLVEDIDALANVPALSSSSVAWGDYDRDGDQDLAIMGISSTLGIVTRLYENDNGVFVNSNPGIFDLRYEGDLIWVDYNKDGFLDIIVSGLNVNDVPTTTIYENIDGQTFVQSTDLNLPNLFSTSIDSGDLDNDGDIDFVINGLKIVNGSNVWKKYIYIREGDSFILEEDYNNQFEEQGVENGIVKIADNNFDGDLDIIIVGATNSKIKSNTFIRNENQNNDNYIQNLDNPSVALFGEFVYFMGKTDDESIRLYRKSLVSGQTEEMDVIPGLIKGAIAIADYNNDGFEDMVLTGENESAESITKIYDGNNSYFGFSENTDITLIGLRNSTAKWVDYDLDGDLDLFLSGTSDDGEFSKLYRTDLLNKNNTPSQVITSLSIKDLGNGKVKLQWDIPEDDFSSSLGYVVRLGTSEGGSELSNTESNLETGQRLITKSPVIYTNSFETLLDPGVYSWSVQSVDDGLKGSEFSEENTFVLTYEWKLLNQGGIIDRAIDAVGKPIVKLTDIDLDNDMDLVYGSREDGSDIQLFILGAKNFKFFGYINNSRNISDIKFLDFNGDFTQDILINSWGGNGNDHLKLYNSSSDGGYNEVFTAPGLYDAKIELIDINNDGEKEIVHIGRTSEASNSQLKVYVYQQEGNVLNGTPIDISGQFGALKYAAYGFGNIDNDDDIDFAITGFSNSGQKSNIYLNETVYTETIAPIYTQIATEFPTAVESTLDFFDYDGDGDLDMALTGQGINGVMFKILQNNGLTGDALSFTEVQNTGLIPIREAKVDFGDYNSDGYADILYSGKVSGQGQVTKLVEFDPETQTYVESDFDLSDIVNASIAFGDVDGDNDLDFTIAGESTANNNNIIKTYLNVRNESAIVQNSTNRSGRGRIEFVVNEKPTQPAGLTTEVLSYDNELETYKVKFTWEASTDDYTSQNGLTYALKVGTSDGDDDIMKVNSLTNGYRLSAGKGNVEHKKEWVLNLPNNDYFWSVQAIDAAFSGSELSETKTINPAISLSVKQYQLLDLSVYPNPVNNDFVNIVSPLSDTKQIHMYDLQGRTIISKNMTGNRLNVSNVSNGVYLLKVIIGAKQKIVKLIIN